MSAGAAERGVPWDALKGATVLVTGAYGFVAAALVETLLAASDERRLGLRVVATGRDEAKARRRFKDLLRRPDLDFFYGDASEPPSYGGPADYIIHAASPASPQAYLSDPVGVIATNVFGTRHLLERAVRTRARGMLFLSSAEVYGAVPQERHPIVESEPGVIDPLAPRSCYAEGKRMGEALCGAWARQHGAPATVARLFHTYGPGMSLDDGRVFADFVADVVAGRPIRVKGDGLDRRPFCYLSDAVAGLLTVLLKGRAGEAYNLANDRAETGILELAERLARLFPERVKGVERTPRPASEGYVPSAVRAWTPSTAKLRALGWEPRVGLDEGFRLTVESFL